MHHISSAGIQQQVLSMPVPQAHDVANHAPHGGRPREAHPGRMPGCRLWEPGPVTAMTQQAGRMPAVQHADSRTELHMSCCKGNANIVNSTIGVIIAILDSIIGYSIQAGVCRMLCCLQLQY